MKYAFHMIKKLKKLLLFLINCIDLQDPDQ